MQLIIIEAGFSYDRAESLIRWLISLGFSVTAEKYEKRLWKISAMMPRPEQVEAEK